jgi:hypothetical protein
MPVMLKNAGGKVLLADGKVAIARACCCSPGCACPDGLADTLCVSGNAFLSGQLAMCTVGACSWCGVSSYSDDAQKFSLAKVDNGFDIGDVIECCWSLSYNDGINGAYKFWDNGNPVGTYYPFSYFADGVGASFATIAECESECLPCDGLECFTGTIPVTTSESYDVVIDNPFGFRLVTCAYRFDGGLLTFKQGYFTTGEGVQFIDFGLGTELSINNDTFVFDCDQIVLAPANLQINTIDINEGGDGSGNLFYNLCFERI